VTLCIVNHNGAKHLVRTLLAVEAQRYMYSEILLLDNGSTDGSQDIFRRLISNGELVQLLDNRSPGTARNSGIERARNDLILFMDNDIELKDGAVEALCQALTVAPQAVAAAPRVLHADNPAMIQYEGADAHFLGHMVLRSEETPAQACPVRTARTNSLVSACFLFDRSRWPAGRFDSHFEFYLEDHDFGLRARLAGSDLLAVGSAVTYHGGGTPGLSLRPGGRYAPGRVRTMIAGRWQVLIKNYAGWTLLVLSPCLAIYELAQLAGVLKKGWWREWVAACKWVWRHAGDLRQARHTVQAMRTIPDRELLKGGPIPFRPELSTSMFDRAAIAILNAIVSGYWRIARRTL
jgi:hypothetical protein